MSVPVIVKVVKQENAKTVLAKTVHVTTVIVN